MQNTRISALRKSQVKANYLANKERINERRRLNRLRDRDEVNAKRKQFYKDNKALVKKQQKLWYDNNKDRIRSSQLKSKYSITIEQYDVLLFKQNNRCLICQITNQEYGKSFHVDHSHATGKVRGLLCARCNTAIGLLKESTTNLQNAIRYLELTNE